MVSMAAVLVRRGDDVDTLDIPYRQILINITGRAGAAWEHHLLLVRINETEWITADSDRVVAHDKLANEVFRTLDRNAAFPEDCKPLLALAELEDGGLEDLLARAKAHADVLGISVAVSIAPGETGGQWLYADPAHPKFGTIVPSGLLTPATTRMEGSAGLLQVALGGNPDRFRWCFIEYVADDGVDRWRVDKREGAGRDPRLLPALPAITGAPTEASFREAWAQSVDPLTDLLGAPDALTPMGSQLALSSSPPASVALEYCRLQGFHPKSQIAIEYCLGIFSLYLIFVRDRLNGRRLYVAQHIARRCLQIQRAVEKNSKAPDFSGLDPLLRHAEAAVGKVHAPEVDKFLTQTAKDEGKLLQNIRLNKEEAEKEKVQRGKNKGNDKNDGG